MSPCWVVVYAWYICVPSCLIHVRAFMLDTCVCLVHVYAWYMCMLGTCVCLVHVCAFMLGTYVCLHARYMRMRGTCVGPHTWYMCPPSCLIHVYAWYICVSPCPSLQIASAVALSLDPPPEVKRVSGKRIYGTSAVNTSTAGSCQHINA